jgi:hypothetical protein
VGVGLAKDGPRLYFGALINRAAALAYWEAGNIHTVITPGTTYPHEASSLSIAPWRIGLIHAKGSILVASVEYAPAITNNLVRDLHWIATLPNPAKPLILEWPSSIIAQVGHSVDWEAKVVGDAPLTYKLTGPRGVVPPVVEGRWRISPLTLADIGNYQLIVTNPFGIARAPTLTISVIGPPHITRAPVPQTLRAGQRLVLEIEAVGGQIQDCRWFKDGSEIRSDEFASPQFSLVRKAMAGEDVGLYSAVVRNESGSVTSAPVRVSMAVEDLPTPTWAGRPVVSAILSDEPTIPFGLKLGPSGKYLAGTARWQGESIWLTGPLYGVDAGGYGSCAFFGINGRRVTAALATPFEMPAGLGPAFWLEVIESDHETDPLSLLVWPPNEGSPVAGLYQVVGLRLEPWLDTTTPPPSKSSGTPDAWVQWHGARQSGNRFALVATTTSGTSLFLVENGQARRWFDLERAAPAKVWGRLYVDPPGFDGNTAAILVRSSGRILDGPSLLISVQPNGSFSNLLQTGSLLPGTFQLVGSIESPTMVQNGTVYAVVSEQSRGGSGGGKHILAWTSGAVRDLARTGTPIRGGGTLRQPRSLRMDPGAQRLLVASEYQRDGVTRDGLFLITVDGVDLVLSSADYGVWRQNASFEPIALAGNRLAFRALIGGRFGIFVTTAEPNTDITTVTAIRTVDGLLRLRAQPRAMLQGAPAATGPWTLLSLPASEWVLSPDEAQGFFRLYRP